MNAVFATVFGAYLGAYGVVRGWQIVKEMIA